MADKKVVCGFVELAKDYDFTKLLLEYKGRELDKVVFYSNKQIEISHITESENTIIGLFVTTQIKNIPPVHKPGNEDDYSAVDLGDGKGLAYPNIFLYDKKKNVFLMEMNRYGVTESAVTYFFDTISKIEGLVKLHPLMSMDAYDRINKMLTIEEVEFQIVNPIAYLKRKAKGNSSVSYIGQLANQFKASKSMKITMRAEELKSLDKPSVLNVAKFFSLIGIGQKSRSKNKFVIKGPIDEDGVCVEETINYMLDRLIGYFHIDEPAIASHLQVIERKSGIERVHKALIPSITKLLG